MFLSFVFLQAAQGGGLLEQVGRMLPLIAIIFVFYFLMFRPQQKRMRDQKRFVENITKGDVVATSSGIIGKINKIEEGIVTLQLDQKTFIKVTLDALSNESSAAIKDKNISIG